MNDNKLVYSTDGGRIRPDKKSDSAPKSDGIVIIRRETKGRKGKGVTIVEGLGLEGPALKKMCSTLKKTCGTGGAVKDYVIEIQGDNREKIKAVLEKQGHQVKLAGG